MKRILYRLKLNQLNKYCKNRSRSDEKELY